VLNHAQPFLMRIKERKKRDSQFVMGLLQLLELIGRLRKRTAPVMTATDDNASTTPMPKTSGTSGFGFTAIW